MVTPVRAGIDVTAQPRLALTPAMAWCATSAALTFEQVRAGGCPLQAAQPDDLSRGLDSRTFWLRVSLANPGATAVERWLSVGHPRLEEVTLYQVDATGGVHPRDVGIRQPLSRRDEVGRNFGAFTLTLPAGTEQTLWLRVASGTAVDLSATTWEPEHYRTHFGRQQFSLTMALGALFIVMVLAVMAFFVVRARSFLYFALSMLGEILIESFRSGALQRHVLPGDLPMPVEVAALGSFLAVSGFTAFFRVFVPPAQRSSLAYRLFLAATALTLLAQFGSMVLDYRAGARIWSFSVNVLILLGLLLAVRSWRSGMRSAGTFVLSFVFVSGLELLRLGAVIGGLPYFWGEVMAGPWALVMTTPLVALSLFQSSQEMQERLLHLELENRGRIRFLAQMSHELRSPLNTIIGSARMLRQQPGRPVDEAATDIERSGVQLLRLIDEILDHARGEAGRLSIEVQPVNWPDFLHTLRKVGAAHAAARQNRFVVALSGDTLDAVMADPQRLQQVLDNLLSNAARHTEQGEMTLRCALRVLDRHRCQVDFEVSDTGEGIRPEDLERIFLPFERGRTAHRAGKGTGMGLTIARQLVQAMGGELTVRSLPGAGATFSFSLTLDRCDAALRGRPDQAWASPARPAPTRPRILVVEDDRRESLGLHRFLAGEGLEVECVPDGESAVTALARRRADLVITDQSMPRGDGWAVLRHLATLQPRPPAVLISSAPPERPADLPDDLHFDAFVPKPLDHAALARRVLQLLGRPPLAEDEAPPVRPPDGKAWPPADATPIRALAELLELGQLTDLIEQAGRLAEADPAWEPYARQVCDAARDLDMYRLNELLAPPPPPAGSSPSA